MSQPIDPKSIKVQQAMARLLTTAPETIIGLLDRLEIPWDKKKDKSGDDCLVIKWKDLVEGEKRNQAEGPFMKKLADEIKSEFGGM